MTWDERTYYCAVMRLILWREFWKRDMLVNRWPPEESYWRKAIRDLCERVHP
jgi:hypothetical protein